MSRVKSDIFVAALLRNASVRGIMGAVVVRGFSDAGAVFIVTYDPLERNHSLWAPAPQAAIFDTDKLPMGGRYFERRLAAADPLQISDALEREKKFDNDIWVVELEAPDAALVDLFDGFTDVTNPL